uniref:Uncharacterized protein n=1 Tax=Lepeophtheirus salmonis TaxID=72036 RepID=A0A0K2U7J4_LEPSM
MKLNWVQPCLWYLSLKHFYMRILNNISVNFRNESKCEGKRQINMGVVYYGHVKEDLDDDAI